MEYVASPPLLEVNMVYCSSEISLRMDRTMIMPTAFVWWADAALVNDCHQGRLHAFTRHGMWV